jgi:hypothetical protein
MIDLASDYNLNKTHFSHCRRKILFSVAQKYCKGQIFQSILVIQITWIEWHPCACASKPRPATMFIKEVNDVASRMFYRIPENRSIRTFILISIIGSGDGLTDAQLSGFETNVVVCFFSKSCRLYLFPMRVRNCVLPWGEPPTNGLLKHTLVPAYTGTDSVRILS